MKTATTSSYQRGVGHHLAAGHDPDTCTACAYDQGLRDGWNSVTYLCIDCETRWSLSQLHQQEGFYICPLRKCLGNGVLMVLAEKVDQ